MLGSVESARKWYWTAYGKHPVAGDYFSVGQELSLLQAFADWVEKGYRKLASRRLSFSAPCSWRFWAKGRKKGALLCGVVKDSADRIGRSYPLLVIGTGPLTQWEGHWDLVPFACERTWNQIERLSTRTYQGFREFDAEIVRITAPSAQWSEFIRERETLGTPKFSADGSLANRRLSDPGNWGTLLSDENDIFLPLRIGTSDDQLSAVSAWHSLIKARFREVPKTIFMGGTPEDAYLAVFQRPLTTTDFVRLWSACSAEGGAHGSMGVR